MDLGSGIAISGVCVALTSAIMRFVPKKSNKPVEFPCPNHKDFVEEKLCDEKHKNIDEKIDTIQETCSNTDKNVLEILKKIKL